jgi:hypothetical protein
LALLTARIEQLLPGTTVKEVGTAMTALWRLQYAPKSPTLLPALMKRALVSGPDLCVSHERRFLSCARPVKKASTVSSSVTTCCSDLPVPQEGVRHMSVQTLANVSAALVRLPVEPLTRPLASAIAAEFCRRDHTGGELPKPEEVGQQLGRRPSLLVAALACQPVRASATCSVSNIFCHMRSYQVAMLVSGQVRTGTADAALCDAAIAAAAAQLPAMKLQDLTTLLFSLGKVCAWPHSQCVVT